MEEGEAILSDRETNGTHLDNIVIGEVACYKGWSTILARRSGRTTRSWLRLDGRRASSAGMPGSQTVSSSQREPAP